MYIYSAKNIYVFPVTRPTLIFPSDLRVFIGIPKKKMKFYHKQPNLFAAIFSSPEPLGSQGELIVYPWSGVRRPSVVRQSVPVRRPQCSNIFSETAWMIKAKFYVEPPWVGGTKVYINGPGHMTKMAAMPIFGKNPSKIFFSRTGGPIFTKLGM